MKNLNKHAIVQLLGEEQTYHLIACAMMGALALSVGIEQIAEDGIEKIRRFLKLLLPISSDHSKLIIDAKRGLIDQIRSLFIKEANIEFTIQLEDIDFENLDEKRKLELHIIMREFAIFLLGSLLPGSNWRQAIIGVTNARTTTEAYEVIKRHQILSILFS